MRAGRASVVIPEKFTSTPNHKFLNDYRHIHLPAGPCPQGWDGRRQDRQPMLQ
jgi:hypothetical protein